MKYLAALSLLLLSSGPVSPPQQTGMARGQVYTDPLYGYTLDLPAGWTILPTPADAVYGAAVFFSYDPLQARQTGLLPPGAVRIQIGIAPTSPGESTAAWVARWRAATAHTATADAQPSTASQPMRIGLHQGYAYTHEGFEQPTLEVNLRLAATQMAVIGIYADDPAGTNEAISLLSSLRPNPRHVFNREVLAVSAAWERSALTSRPEMAHEIEAPAGTCRAGTFPGVEAPDSPITLHMPFRAGERWMVGKWGSFYGNGYHCNSNDDYYATDWNRLDNVLGSDILPVADGTIDLAQVPTCPTTGLGCYVRIVHTGGIRTTYAHLSAVYRTSGFVTHSERIGAEGSTGNSTGPHLHLAFRQWVGTAYVSRCYNDGKTCPNGEAPKSPQTVKPSPMLTSSGLTTLVDGGIYTSVNFREVKLYADSGLTGSVVFSGTAGFSNAPNRDAKSMSIPFGWSVKTWRGDDRAGEQRCWKQSVPELADYDWADAIDSIEIFEADTCPPAAPELSYPPRDGYIGDGMTLLTWNAAGDEHYGELWEVWSEPDVSSTLTVPAVITPTVVITFGWQPTASAAVGPLSATHIYSWRVMSRNANGESLWSETRSFTVLPSRTFMPIHQRGYE